MWTCVGCSQPSDIPVFGCILLMVTVCLALLSIRPFRRNWRAAKLIRNTPLTDIGSLTESFAKGKGQAALASKKVTSPMRGADCVYCHFTVEVTDRLSEHGGWRKMVDDRHHVPFYVKDTTGTALITLAGARA